MKFRKKPIVIEAVQWTASRKSWDEIMKLGGGDLDWQPGPMGSNSFIITTLDGDMTVSDGDWVIKEPFATKDRRFYPCKPNIFEKAYEPVEESL